MDRPAYQVVLSGGLISGFSREAVLVSLARLFQTSAARLVEVLEGGEVPIDDLLEADQAATLQQRLERMGVRARIDRVGEDPHGLRQSGLHLHSLTDSAAAGLMRCPACGHQQLVTKRCDECGVVFATFNRQRVAGEPRLPRDGALSAPPSPPGRPQRLRDIHAHAHAEWREDWMDDGNELPTEQYRINLFMGPRSNHLSTICERMAVGRRTHWLFSWAGSAVISPFLWAMYRKMWAWGMVIFVTEILIPVVLVTLGSKQGVSGTLVSIGVGLTLASRVFWPSVLKYLYCRHTRQTIMFMHRAAASTFASDVEVANRGGTSRTSAFVGVVVAVVISLLAWSIVDTLHASWLVPSQPFVSQDAPPQEMPLAEPSEGNAETEPPQVEAKDDGRDQPLANQNSWVATRNRLRVLGQTLSAWFVEDGRDQDPAQLDLAAISQAVSLEPDSMRDGWGRPIVFESDGAGYRLISPGPDGILGNADDVDYRRILDR